MRQNFLTKMYDGCATEGAVDKLDPMKNLASAVEAHNNFYGTSNLATLTPAPDVREVAVAFSKYCYSQDTNIDKLTFDYWYENIYPGVIEQSKK